MHLAVPNRPSRHLPARPSSLPLLSAAPGCATRRKSRRSSARGARPLPERLVPCAPLKNRSSIATGTPPGHSHSLRDPQKLLLHRHRDPPGRCHFLRDPQNCSSKTAPPWPQRPPWTPSFPQGPQTQLLCHHRDPPGHHHSLTHPKPSSRHRRSLTHPRAPLLVTTAPPTQPLHHHRDPPGHHRSLTHPKPRSSITTGSPLRTTIPSEAPRLCSLPQGPR